MNSYLERLRQELEEAMGNASTGELGQAPAGKWSPALILEHLLLTYKHTNRGLEKCLEQGSSLATRATVKDRMASMLVVNLGYMPTGRKAPERAMPQGTPAEEVQQAIMPALEKMDATLNECDRRFGSRTKIMNHPILGPLTANEWRKFHWVHGRHHARQIRDRIKRS